MCVVQVHWYCGSSMCLIILCCYYRTALPLVHCIPRGVNTSRDFSCCLTEVTIFRNNAVLFPQFFRQTEKKIKTLCFSYYTSCACVKEVWQSERYFSSRNDFASLLTTVLLVVYSNIVVRYYLYLRQSCPNAVKLSMSLPLKPICIGRRFKYYVLYNLYRIEWLKRFMDDKPWCRWRS